MYALCGAGGIEGGMLMAVGRTGCLRVGFLHWSYGLCEEVGFGWVGGSLRCWVLLLRVRTEEKVGLWVEVLLWA